MNMKMSVVVVAAALSGMHVQAMVVGGGALVLGAADYYSRPRGERAGVREQREQPGSGSATSASLSAASEAKERDSKRDAELKSSVAAVKMKAPESPRTQSRRALQSVDVESFKAEKADIKALEAFIAQGQRQVCRLREQLMVQNAQETVRSERANLQAQIKEAEAKRKHETEESDRVSKRQIAEMEAAFRGIAQAAPALSQLAQTVPALTQSIRQAQAQVQTLQAQAAASVVVAPVVPAFAPATETPAPGSVQAHAAAFEALAEKADEKR
jgi:hypothetical protein